MYPALRPAFALWLAKQPEGAVIELPSSYAGNTWHVQHLHGHPSTHGKRPISWLAAINDYGLLLGRLNEVAGQGWQLAPVPNNMASEIPFGIAVLPAGCVNRDAERSSIDTTSFPNIKGKQSSVRDRASALPTRRITPASVIRDYAKVYDDTGRYVCVFRPNCNWLAPGHGDELYKQFKAILQPGFGHPIYEDTQTAIFLMPAPSARTNSFLTKLTERANLASQHHTQ